MGISTILSAKKVILVALGESKATAVKTAVEGERGSFCPASFLQDHFNSEIIVDLGAAGELSRVKIPWILSDEFDWSTNLEESEVESEKKCNQGIIMSDLLRSISRGSWKMRMQAVIWLSQKCKRPIKCLEADDYLQNGLGPLLGQEREESRQIQSSGREDKDAGVGANDDFCSTFSPERLNRKVIEALESITARDIPAFLSRSSPLSPPSHQNKDQDARSPMESHQIGRKKVLVLSPHPDDDVISMGGTLRLLSSQGYEVHVAYQTTGCIAVRDQDVLQRFDFAEGLFETVNIQPTTPEASKLDHFRNLIDAKQPGDPDSIELQKMKTLVRRCEAIAAATDCGVLKSRLHFLELPFYSTGTVLKAPVTAADEEILKRKIEEIKPDVIFAAGDLSDPHGTHRTCLELMLRVLRSLETSHSSLEPLPRVLLYRGAWQEWSLHEADTIVPLTKQEMQNKIRSICMHQSQKDPPPFPGVDMREFWQRAKSRNEATAEIMRCLGLPAAAAAEVFMEIKLKSE